MSDRDLCKKHLLLALGDIQEPLPKSHDELIEHLRDYFVGQKIEVFSRFIAKHGDGEFREVVKETVLESGRYTQDDDGNILPVA